MRPRLLLWSVVAAVGLVAMLATGYLVVRGPFLGGPLLDPIPLMVATGGFVAGLVVFALGGSKAMRIAV